MEDDLNGRRPQWKITSLAQNSRKQLEIAWNEQNFLSISFSSTILDLTQPQQES